VDLKAELYRKETQLKREKVDTTQPKVATTYGSIVLCMVRPNLTNNIFLFPLYLQKAPIWQKKKKESKRKDEKTASEKTATSPDSSYDKQLEKSRLLCDLCCPGYWLKMVQLLCIEYFMSNYSRIMLEAKSALYNKLSKGEIEGIALFLSLVVSHLNIANDQM
jgi:hypothetical protein